MNMNEITTAAYESASKLENGTAVIKEAHNAVSAAIYLYKRRGADLTEKMARSYFAESLKALRALNTEEAMELAKAINAAKLYIDKSPIVPSLEGKAEYLCNRAVEAYDRFTKAMKEYQPTPRVASYEAEYSTDRHEEVNMKCTTEQFVSKFTKDPSAFEDKIADHIKKHLDLNVNVKEDLTDVFNDYMEEFRYEIEDCELNFMHVEDGDTFTEEEILNAVFDRLDSECCGGWGRVYDTLHRPSELTNEEWDSLIENSLNKVSYWTDDLAVYVTVPREERDEKCNVRVDSIERRYSNYLEDLQDGFSTAEIKEIAKALIMEGNEA